MKKMKLLLFAATIGLMTMTTFPEPANSEPVTEMTMVAFDIGDEPNDDLPQPQFQELSRQPIVILTDRIFQLPAQLEGHVRMIVVPDLDDLTPSNTLTNLDLMHVQIDVPLIQRVKVDVKHFDGRDFGLWKRTDIYVPNLASDHKRARRGRKRGGGLTRSQALFQSAAKECHKQLRAGDLPTNAAMGTCMRSEMRERGFKTGGKRRKRR